MNRILMAAVFLFVVSAVAQAQDAPKQSPLEFTVGETKLKFYGFVRVDIQYDDSKPNDPQIIQWVKSEDSSIAPGANNAHSGDSQLNIHPKLTRFGFDVTGTPIEKLGNAKASAKIEVDFYGTTTSESRDALRMRHGYGKLAWDSFSILFGQTNDVISPLWPVVNNDMVMWNAGNLGDRRPQLRFEYWNVMANESKLGFQLEIGQTGANDAQDGAATGTPPTLDGVDAAVPTLQFRAYYNGNHFWMEKKKWELGLWIHSAKEELQDGEVLAATTETKWTSSCFGLDLVLPLIEGLELQGEFWSGKNLNDVRGGIGQGVNFTAGDPDAGKEIESSGGWAQVGYALSDMYTIYVGYTFDNPEDGLPAAAGFKDKNSVIYLANRIKPSANLTFGLDYLNWKTEWTGGMKDGTDGRINIFAQWNF